MTRQNHGNATGVLVEVLKKEAMGSIGKEFGGNNPNPWGAGDDFMGCRTFAMASATMLPRLMKPTFPLSLHKPFGTDLLPPSTDCVVTPSDMGLRIPPVPRFTTEGNRIVFPAIPPADPPPEPRSPLPPRWSRATPAAIPTTATASPN